MRHLLLLASLISPGLALAQQTEDATAKVTALSRHITEMRELLESSDFAVRDAAVETALNDPSPSVRGLAVFYALRRYEHLPLQFSVPAGSPIRQESLPSMSLRQVKWTADGRSMSASGGGCGNYPVTGQLAGDRLRLQFVMVCFAGDLFGSSSNQPGVARNNTSYQGCEAELTSTKARDALTGTLRCPGLPTVLPLTLSLG